MSYQYGSGGGAGQGSSGQQNAGGYPSYASGGYGQQAAQQSYGSGAAAQQVGRKGQGSRLADDFDIAISGTPTRHDTGVHEADPDTHVSVLML